MGSKNKDLAQNSKWNDISSEETSRVKNGKSKRSQGRISEAPRVVFEEPGSSSTDQNEDSTDEESTKQTTVSNTRTIDTLSMTDHEEEPLGNTLREIEATTRRELASQGEFSRPPSGPSKSDETDSLEHESTKRNTRFLSPTIEGMFAQFPQVPRKPSHRHDEIEAIFPTTTETSATTSGTRMRHSENIGVQSMLFDVPQTDCLPHLEAKAFAIVLQETLDLLEILQRVIPSRVDERWNESYKTIDEKYGTPKAPNIMFRAEMGLLPLVPEISEKIQRDRTYIYNVLKGTARDIQCLRRYDRLETEVDDIVRILEGEHNLEVNHEIWMGQVKQLQELIETDRIESAKEARNFLISAQRMNAEVDDATFSNTSKLRYVKRWEEARLEQQKLRLEIKEQKMNDELEDCAIMERADQIISGEVRHFLEANTRDLEDDIATWTIRYNEEIERLQQEINDMKEKIELQKLELQNLQELHDERQIFLEKCYEEQELAKKEAEYWKAVNDASILIQKIWRGYMVRHKLGEYKKLFESFKKKKKNKKSKKNVKGKKKA